MRERRLDAGLDLAGLARLQVDVDDVAELILDLDLREVLVGARAQLLVQLLGRDRAAFVGVERVEERERLLRRGDMFGVDPAQSLGPQRAAATVVVRSAEAVQRIERAVFGVAELAKPALISRCNWLLAA